MSVQSGTSAVVYTGNNSTVTAYPVLFPYLLASDIYVAVRDALDVDTILQQGIDYTLTPTVDGNGNITGGSVVTTAAYNNTWTVTIFRQVSLTQLTELPEAGPISSRVLEKADDKAMMALQQIHRRVLALEGFDDGGSIIVIPEGSIGDVLQDVQTFSDDTARGNAIPKRVGQLGVQVDNGTLWQANGPGSGAWERAVTLAKTLATAPSLSGILDVTGNTRGDILYRGASAWARLAAGTAGQILRAGGSGGDPSYITGGKLAQVVTAENSTGGTTTTVIPVDDTIPQSSEGVEFLTVTITPTNVNSTLIVEFVGYVSSNALTNVTVALFRDSGVDAIGVNSATLTTSGLMQPMVVKAAVSATSLTATTFKLRYGPASSTGYIQRTAGGTAFSTADKATLTVMEVLP